MTAPARVAAYHALRAISDGRLDLPAALERARRRLEDERDRALAAEITLGTLRWRGKLDYLLEHFTRRSIARLDPEIVDILRLSSYQLLHLDRVPAAAIVSDAVELARMARKPSAASLVNATLRALIRDKATLPLPTADRTVDYLAVTLSHPRWLVERWLARYGPDAAERWARFNNSAAPLVLRANRLRVTSSELAAMLARHGVSAEPTAFAPDGLIVAEGNPLTTPLNDAGLFVVQDEASQLIPLLAHVQPGERVLDACASPGGKTTAMAGDMRNRGLIIAADLRPRRMRLLRAAVQAQGATCVRLARLDARAPLPFRGWFDCILLDAPCSGLGTIRRDPDIRWRRTTGDLASYASVQMEMLNAAAGSIRPGGRMVYATCSSEPEENDDVVGAFLERRPDFVRVDLRDVSRDLGARLGPLLDDAGQLRTLPHAHHLEAFFGVVLRRIDRA